MRNKINQAETDPNPNPKPNPNPNWRNKINQAETEREKTVQKLVTIDELAREYASGKSIDDTIKALTLTLTLTLILTLTGWRLFPKALSEENKKLISQKTKFSDEKNILTNQIEDKKNKIGPMGWLW